MWWYLLPVGVMAGALSYTLVRSAATGKGTGAKSEADHPDPDAVFPPPPNFWAYVVRWSEIFENAEADLPPVALPPAPPSTATTVERIEAVVTPSRLTGLTGMAVVGAIVWQATHPYFFAELLQVILLGAFVGIGTNWLAIKMLFRPLEPRFGLQGVIPANRDRIIDSIAGGVARNLLDRDTIRQAVHDSNIVRGSIDELVVGTKRLVESERFRGDVTELVREAVVAFIRNNQFRKQVLAVVTRLAQLLPSQLGPLPKAVEKALTGLFERVVKDRGEDIIAAIENNIQASVRHLGDQAIVWLEQLPEGIDERRAELEAVITESVARRAGGFDIESIVREKLSAYTAADLERLLLAATDKHLAKIQYFGWILGALAAPTARGLEFAIRWLAQ